MSTQWKRLAETLPLSTTTNTFVELLNKYRQCPIEHTCACDYEGNALGKWGVPVLLSVLVVPLKCAITACACVTARRKQSKFEISPSSKTQNWLKWEGFFYLFGVFVEVYVSG